MTPPKYSAPPQTCTRALPRLALRCVPFDWISLCSSGHYKPPLEKRSEASFNGFLFLCGVSCPRRMGLPEDTDDGACQDEQRGEGGDGESPAESLVSKPLLPVGKKKRKGRRRYYSEATTLRGNV